MQAVIMAGGVGQRLRPLTCTLPKPMVPVMNRPVMHYSVELLSHYGMQDIAVTLQYLPDEISGYFGDGSAYGVRMTYFVEDTPLGTAGSVRATKPQGTFVVVSGDALTDVRLDEALAFHREKGAAATLVLKKVDYPLEYGVVLTDSGGRIERFFEKPGWGEVFSDLANTGIYILEEEVMNELGEGKMDFAQNLFPRLLQQGVPMYGYVTKDYWCDIGDLTQYLQAHRDILDGKCRVSLKHAQHEGEGVYVQSGVRMEGKAIVKGPCFLGENCVIGAGVALEPYTVLGGNVRVGDGASIKRSVVWDGAVVEAEAELRGAVVCKRAIVGAHASLYEGAVMGEESSMGDYACLKQGVYLWPQKRLEAHQTRAEHLVWQDADMVFQTGMTWPLQALTPAMCAKLGAAIGAEAGQSVALACDGNAGAVIARMAVMSGLLSQGADVFDFGPATLPVLRFGQRSVNADAGVFISAENITLSVQVLDKSGLPSELARKFKPSSLQDMRPAPAHMLGLLRMQRNIAPLYAADVMRTLDLPGLQGMPFKAVVGGEPAARSLLLTLLSDARWAAVAVDGGSKAVAEETARLQADIGFVPSTGDKLEVFGSDGVRLSEDARISLLTLSILQRGAERLVLPMRASDTLLNLSEQYGASAIRLGERTRLRTMLEMDEASAAIYMDAVMAAMHICQLLSKSGEPLHKLLQELPETPRSEATVSCSWKDIGRIFRTLVETQPREKLDLLEGVRVRHERGWALVMPEVEAARCRILCESASEEYAESLTDLYVKRIQGIVREGEVKS